MKRVKRLGGFAVIILTLAIVASGCASTAKKTESGSSKPLAASNKTIEIKDFAFSPETVTVGVDSRITWINKDTSTHTVTGEKFKSGELGAGESFSYQFASPGTYEYKCGIHSYMTGTVVVK